jgi:hypothetical protein
MLDFVNPSSAAWRLLGRSRKAWFDEGWGLGKETLAPHRPLDTDYSALESSQDCRNSSGSLAMFTAIRRDSVAGIVVWREYNRQQKSLSKGPIKQIPPFCLGKT